MCTKRWAHECTAKVAPEFPPPAQLDATGPEPERLTSEQCARQLRDIVSRMQGSPERSVALTADDRVALLSAARRIEANSRVLDLAARLDPKTEEPRKR